MGNPLNNFENMMMYIYQELAVNKISFWEKIKLNIEYFRYIFFFEFFKVCFTFKNIFIKSREQLAEESNAEKVFEYLH